MPIQGRIVHLLGSLCAGGTERAAVDLVLGMKRSGLAVELWALTAARDAVGDHWHDQLVQESVPVRVGPSPRMSLAVVRWLASELSAPDLRLLHVHLSYAERAYYLARLLHRRQYSVLRKLTNMEFPGGTTGFAWRHSDIQVSVAGGESTFEFFNGRIDGDLHCIPNGMNFHWPVRDSAERDQRLGDLGLDPAKRHFLTVGSMRGAVPRKDQKAHDTLIQAWQRAALGGGAAQLHLLGTGRLVPQLQALAAGDASVVFHGLQVGVERWLLAADCFVLPSRWEGLPNAAIEAVGTGLSCIFSDIPPCREIASDDTAFFPVDDVPALATLLRSRFAEPEPKLDVAHVEEVRRKYGMERPLAAYCRLYEDLLRAG